MNCKLLPKENILI